MLDQGKTVSLVGGSEMGVARFIRLPSILATAALAAGGLAAGVTQFPAAAQAAGTRAGQAGGGLRCSAGQYRHPRSST